MAHAASSSGVIDSKSPPPPPAMTTAHDDEGLAPHKPAAGDTAIVEALHLEHEMTFRQAVKLYPASIAWSLFVSIGVIMLAFDPQIVGSMFAMPQFQKDFGYEKDGEVCCP